MTQNLDKCQHRFQVEVLPKLVFYVQHVEHLSLLRGILWSMYRQHIC